MPVSDTFINIFVIVMVIWCLATSLMILGYYFIECNTAKKRAIGFYLWVVGGMLWSFCTILTGSPLIFVVILTNSILFVLSVRGI